MPLCMHGFEKRGVLDPCQSPPDPTAGAAAPQVPNVSRQEFSVIDISDDGFVSLMDDGGNTKDDLQLPKGTEELEKLAVQIKSDFDDGKELIVVVLKVRSRRMAATATSSLPSGFYKPVCWTS